MNPRTNLLLGIIGTAIAASILAFDFPYHATIAAALLILLFASWLFLVLRGNKMQKRQTR